MLKTIWRRHLKRHTKTQYFNYFDGVPGGVISGWSAEADYVKIYINDKLIGEVACKQFREDLIGVVSDPNCSFLFPIALDHIQEYQNIFDSLIIKIDFIFEEKVFDQKELNIPFSLIYDQIKDNEENDDSLTQDNGDLLGLVDGVLTGWHNDAKQANIYIEDRLISCSDLIANTEFNRSEFALRLDGAKFSSTWRDKKALILKVEFLLNDKIESVYQKFIDSTELLNSIVTVNGIRLEDQVSIIRDSLLWDENYYINQLTGSVRKHKSLIYDYLIVGKKMGYDPNPYFDTYYYLANNLDVANDGVNPFIHYLTLGEKENRRPNAYFNPQLYLQFNPDLTNWESSLLSHFVLAGKNEGRIYNEFPINAENNEKNDPYLVWRMKNEQFGFQEVASNLNSFKHYPLISIVVPVYNPNKQLLIDCIESVINQSYPNWELCLADDKSPKAHVREVLEEYAAKDKRIKPVFREKNGHISAASNSALKVAEGEWLALLDHDDELHEHALYHVVKSLNEHPDATFIYSDEDKINEQGERIDPHFKSDWNLDLLYSQNYVSHLGVYKTEIINKIGGFRLGYEGSQDYDLLLRYSREIDQAKIVHIPKVLYHWRMVEGSTALASGEKSYTTDAGIKALEDHFKVLKKNVTVEQGKHANIYKVNWPSVNDKNKEPLVTLIIPTYNGYEITKQAIDSILEKSTYQNFEILLVDNNSDDEIALAYFDELNQHEKVTVLRYPYPFNYSAINNFAAKQAKGEIIGLINNDVEVINPEWLTEMVSHAQREDIGCVGAMLYFENDTIQHAGVITGIGDVAGHSHKHFKRGDHGYFSRLKVVQNLSAVTAACLLVRKSVFDEVNGLNEKDLTVAFNDVDFCLKVQAKGYRNLWTPYAELYHYESISRGAEDNPEKVARFNKEVDYMKETWETHVKADSCYSPNLTLAREDFSVLIE